MKKYLILAVSYVTLQIIGSHNLHSSDSINPDLGEACETLAQVVQSKELSDYENPPKKSQALVVAEQNHVPQADLRPYMDLIPLDVQRLIFQYVVQDFNQKNLLAVGRVSKGWRDIASKLWENHELVINHYIKSEREVIGISSAILENFVSSIFVNLKIENACLNEAQLKIIGRSNKVKSLHLNGDFRIAHTDLSHLTNLTSLSIDLDKRMRAPYRDPVVATSIAQLTN